MSGNFQKSAAELLATPIQFVKGVGPDRAALLQRLGLNTARDVLFFFPRDYEDMSELRSIEQLVEDQPCSVWGEVDEVDARNVGVNRTLLGVLIRQGSQYLRGIWFNQPFMKQKFTVGAKVLLSGTPKQNGFRWEMVHPRVSPIGPQETPVTGQVLPVYSLTEGLSQALMRKIVSGVVESHGQLVDEVFPDDFLDEHRLWPIRAALPQIHTPADKDALVQARRRFIYQELLVMQIALAQKQSRRTQRRNAPLLANTALIDSRITRLFPFELTSDQKRAINEVAADLGRDVPMNRLLQGDVGTGKTVVAQYAMLLAVARGYQAAIIAPTEVLARQHARTFARSLAESKVRIGLLTGSLTSAERRQLLLKITAGEIDLIIGTHAVMHAIARADVLFTKLGLVVIDEQHKFGVRQRATVRQTGLDPHYLVMTATPIPRTVSMTMFGDLDVSTLRTPPPGRQPVHSYLAADEKRDSWWEFFRKKVREGRQGYVITPLVEGMEEDTIEEPFSFSDEQPADHSPTFSPPDSAPPGIVGEPPTDEQRRLRRAVANVTEAYEALVNGPLADFRLDLIHGRMSAADKDFAMEKFRKGDTQVLVATSVVEVGVDVANATVMTIESGERFGLAQLHQLRGRVSRGSFPGYVCIFADPKSDDSQKRLEAFTKTTDGFELAELDFQLRGPGDLFGTRQHGLPPLRIADLQRDGELLEEARRDAQTLIAADPDLQDARFEKLRRMVIVRYGEALHLGDVG